MNCNSRPVLYVFGWPLYVSTPQNVQSENPWGIKKKPLALSFFVRSVRSILQGSLYNAYISFIKNIVVSRENHFPKTYKTYKVYKKPSNINTFSLYVLLYVFGRTYKAETQR